MNKVNIPFGKVLEDGTWFLSWRDRIALLEYYVEASGHSYPEQAHEEFWEYVNDSEGRYLHKDFEPLPEHVEEEFNSWVMEGE